MVLAQNAQCRRTKSRNSFAIAKLLIMALLFQEHVDIVKFLLERSEPGRDRSRELNEAYAAAMPTLNIEVIKILLSAGADVNFFNAKSHLIPIAPAILNNRLDLVKLLCEHGLDLNQPDEEGFSALPLAVMMGRLEIVKHLLDRGE